MGTESLTVYIKMDNIYKYIAGDIEKKFDTSNYEQERLLPQRKNKKNVGLMKDGLGEKIMKELAELRGKLIVT